MPEECRHIRVNGTKCKAAALRSHAWCYFHQGIYRSRATNPQPRTFSQPETVDYGCLPVTTPPKTVTEKPDLPIELPLIEDLSSIQLAISRILLALAANTIHPKRAGLLLYGLQIAAQNLPKQPLGRSDTVTDIAYTEDDIPFDTTPYYYAPPEQPDQEDSEETEGDEEDTEDQDPDGSPQQEDEDKEDEAEQDEQDEEHQDEEENEKEEDEQEEDDDDQDDEEEEEEEEESRPRETCQHIAARLKLILRRLDASEASSDEASDEASDDTVACIRTTPAVILSPSHGSTRKLTQRHLPHRRIRIAPPRN